MNSPNFKNSAVSMGRVSPNETVLMRVE